MPDDIKAPEKPASSPPAPAAAQPKVNDISGPAPVPAPAASAGQPKENLPVKEPLPNPSDNPAAALDEKASKIAKDKKADKEKPKAEKPKKPDAQRAPGTGAAIFAAVVIVLALGAMFTYAYLKSQNL
jgi:hypothetical protein